MMLRKSFLPIVLSKDEKKVEELSSHIYKNMIESILYRILPSDFSLFFASNSQKLPVLTIESLENQSNILRFSLVGISQKHVLSFFLDMISKWMIPGKKLPISHLFFSEFCLHQEDQIYVIAESHISVDSEEDYKHILANLNMIESELSLGVRSYFFAKRLLEAKGLDNDSKTALIQEYVIRLLELRPQFFDAETMTEMQQILIMSHDNFKKQRTTRHLARIIAIQSLFRKQLLTFKTKESKKRILIKVIRAQIDQEGVKQNVLGIIIGVSFLKEKEALDRKKILIAIQHYIPDAEMVDQSYLDSKKSLEKFSNIYLEIRKTTQEKFSADEVLDLRNNLAKELLDDIEEPVYPLFMPRNEEDIMRSILNLSYQIKFLKDMPQVIINFDEQTQSKLVFTIIIVRVVKSNSLSVQELFMKANISAEYFQDRCKTVGYLRKRYVKEAVVFRMRIQKDKFLRPNNSIDLNKARQAIVFELYKAIGDFRDFNGGMISKQNETLTELKALMGKLTHSKQLLLESFYYSIHPIAMRTVLDAAILKDLFLYIYANSTKQLDIEDDYQTHTEFGQDWGKVVVQAKYPFQREELLRYLSKMDLMITDITMAHLKIRELYYTGYLFRLSESTNPEKLTNLIQGFLIK